MYSHNKVTKFTRHGPTQGNVFFHTSNTSLTGLETRTFPTKGDHTNHCPKSALSYQNKAFHIETKSYQTFDLKIVGFWNSATFLYLLTS